MRGIRLVEKKGCFFYFVRNLKLIFIFLQETHASNSDYNFWKNQWGDNIWMSYGSNRSASVAIMIGNFKGRILKSKALLFGRWLLLVVELNDIIFILGNIYATNISSRNRSLFQEFEEEISTFLRSFPKAKLTMGGDWNSIEDIKNYIPKGVIIMIRLSSLP